MHSLEAGLRMGHDARFASLELAAAEMHEQLRLLSALSIQLARADRVLHAQQKKLALDCDTIFTVLHKFGLLQDTSLHTPADPGILNVLSKDARIASSIMRSLGAPSVLSFCTVSPSCIESVLEMCPKCLSKACDELLQSTTLRRGEERQANTASSDAVAQSIVAGYKDLKLPSLLHHSARIKDIFASFVDASTVQTASCASCLLNSCFERVPVETHSSSQAVFLTAALPKDHRSRPREDLPMNSPKDDFNVALTQELLRDQAGAVLHPASAAAGTEVIPSPALCNSLLEESPRQGGSSATSQCNYLALLQDLWQYSTLAESLTCAMGAASVRQFRGVSRAGQECMRQSLSPCNAPSKSNAPSSHVIVRVHGLLSRPELNGRLGRLVPYTQEWERCHVILPGGEGIRVRRSNLQVLPTSKPLREPTGNGEPVHSKQDVLSTAVQKGAVFVFGGHDASVCCASSYFFLPHTHSWYSLPPMAKSRSNPCSVAVDGRLYVLGGYDRAAVLDSVECFDTNLGTWQPLPSMLQARACFCAAALGDGIYVCGGCGKNAVPLSSLECFSLRTGRWTLLPPMSKPRAIPDMLVVEGCMYVSGGSNIRDDIDSTVERFSPERGTWTGCFRLPWRCFSGALAAHKNYLYICGGRGGVCPLPDAARFHHLTERWERLPHMSTARCGALAAASPRGDVLVCGGSGRAERSQLQRLPVECFRHVPEIWETVEGFTTHCRFHGIVGLANCLYVLGGRSRTGVTDRVGCLDLAVQPERWQCMPPMPEALIGSAYSVLQGQV